MLLNALKIVDTFDRFRKQNHCTTKVTAACHHHDLLVKFFKPFSIFLNVFMTSSFQKDIAQVNGIICVKRNISILNICPLERETKVGRKSREQQSESFYQTFFPLFSFLSSQLVSLAKGNCIKIRKNGLPCQLSSSALWKTNKTKNLNSQPDLLNLSVSLGSLPQILSSIRHFSVLFSSRGKKLFIYFH